MPLSLSREASRPFPYGDPESVSAVSVLLNGLEMPAPIFCRLLLESRLIL